MSNFQSILDAFDKYAEQTGINLNENPFADKVKGCQSPNAVLLLLQDNLKAFKEYRDQNRKFIDCLSPVIQFVHAFSGILGETAGLMPFQPAKLIFVGIDVLFTAADGVSASYDALLELFECLGNFLKRLHIYSGISLDPSMMDVVAKIMVELISILALAKKQIHRGRLKQFAKKLLGDSEIETILKRLDRLTQEEARMTAAQTFAIVHGLLDNMKTVMDGGEVSTRAIRQTLVAMQEVANAINKMRRDQLQKDARSWISPPDPSKNHVIARRTHHGESAVWFTRGPTFKNWDLTGGLLWIHGIPGSGKSILCSSIIEEAKTLRKAGLGLVAYYYFDFRDTPKQDVRGLLSSLVAQLSAKSDLCYNILSDLYSEHDAGSQLPDDDALTQCLKDMLELPDQPPIYIIIDALDECPNSSGAPSPRELVLELIEDLVESRLPNLRICVTSRPEADIQDALGPLVSHSVSLHDEAGQKQDITDYINSAVQSDRKMRKWRPEDRQLVIDALTQRADGMFRWVFCQIEALRGCFPPAIRRALEELPSTLDATYERTLQGIEKAKQTYAYRLFQCIAISIRPLRVEELAEVLAVRLDAGEDPEYRGDWRPEDAQQAVLSACSSLIMVVNVDGSAVVQFSHFSVKEFLMSSRLANGEEHLSRYHIVPHSAHAVLARASLSVLLNLGDKVDKSAVEKRPFAIYAARYWIDHGKCEGASSSIHGLMECLFDSTGPYFATWVWIYDVDRPWRGSMATVHPTQPAAEPLYYAALCGFRSLTEHLMVAHRVDVDARGGNYGTALNAAFVKGEIDIALALLQNGADINALDAMDMSSLHRAAIGGHGAIVELLLEHQADVNVQTDNTRNTPLFLAARSGELDVCRMLLKHGADVASVNINGWTPLHIASLVPSQLEVVQLLFQHDAALDKTTLDQETPLHVASRSGNVEVAHFLIEQGADTMAKDKDGDTPLHNASRYGSLDLVETLLKCDVDVNTRNIDEETPLKFASRKGKHEVARCLIGHGAEIDCRDKKGWTPLHAATRNGHLDIVQLLLDLGADVHVRNGNNDTPLILASLGGHIAVSRFLIDHQADVNSIGKRGWTSLHSSSRYGHADVVRLLLDHRADINVQTAALRSSLHLASANGHLKVSELLIERGAEVDVRDEDQKTPLDLASGNGKLEVARLLIKRGSNVNSQDNEGRTPSHSAAQNGHLSLVELLVDSGADMCMRDSSEKTPLDLAHESRNRDITSFLERRLGDLRALYSGESSDDDEGNSLHSALEGGRLDVLQRLLDCGADVDERDEQLQTPLNVALMDGQLEFARTLIKYGADVNTRDIDGCQWTPLHKAARFGHIDVVQFLIDNSADVNSQEGDGWTPLHVAARIGHNNVVRSLLDNNANINASQRQGSTPLHMASGNGQIEVVWSLLGRGADVQLRDVYGRTPYQVALTYGYREIAQLLSEYVPGMPVGGV